MTLVLQSAVFLHRRPAVFLTATCLLASLTACANAPTGKSLEQAFAADPRLQSNSTAVVPSSNPSLLNARTALLPTNFPAEIPRYPNAQLKAVILPTQGTGGTPATASELTHWFSSDPSNFVATFYQKQFQTNGWQILRQPTDEQGGTFEARKNDLQVTVSIQPQLGGSTPRATPATPTPEVATEFVIQYVRNSAAQATSDIGTVPKPGEPNFIGPVPPGNSATQPSPSLDSNAVASNSQGFTDLKKVPPELRQYVKDLAELDVLPLESASSKSNATSTQLEPNKILSRREYARWLVAVNNQLHITIPAQQIRLAALTDQPAFQDVPQTDRDFPIIQGLAEAGLIPSPLSGNSTTVLFRPDAPLTREQMILWKVPLDIRRALPNASIDAVKQTWGFQDAARIDPNALRAVLADFQNGDQSSIRRVLGYTTLFQPQKPVTRAEAAAALWYFGTQGEGVSAKDALQLKRQQSQSATAQPTPSSSASP